MVVTTEKRWLEKLARVEGLGWKRYQLLCQYFGSGRKVWEAEAEEWQKLGVPKRVVASFREVKRRKLGKDNQPVIVYEDEEYPQRLREIASPPLGLFYEGDISLLKKKKMIAVVGTRRMSRYGEKITRRLVRGLVERGWVIVSGLARGVDKVAHEECLRRGGKTVAVLGHGLGVTYPPENGSLRREIVKRGGLVVSEFSWEVRPRREYFVGRNRLVAGLSEGVLVTEAYAKSGTKTTVGFAVSQGKEVWVVPGSPDMLSYRGCVEMIRDGAWPVVQVEDIVLSS